MQAAAIILLSIGFGAYRVWVEPTSLQLGDTYKDLAHLFVGGLFGAWAFAKWGSDDGLHIDWNRGYAIARVCLWCAVLLTLLEVICAVMGAK